jgi:hypothetical protein
MLKDKFAKFKALIHGYEKQARGDAAQLKWKNNGAEKSHDSKCIGISIVHQKHNNSSGRKDTLKKKTLHLSYF